MAQPDVVEFVATGMRTQLPGTAIASVPIVTHDDDGTHQAPYIFLEDAGFIHDVGVPAYLPFRLSLTAYHRTNALAGALYRAATDILHGAANVLGSDLVGFWSAEDETGPQPGPEGRIPARSGITAIYMPERALTA